jgi:hypothetical protein
VNVKHIRTDENIWEYVGAENFFVLPITSFVRADGGLALVHPFSKEVSGRFPDLQKRWGYFITSGVVPPTYRTSTVNFIGLPDREHYASKINPEILEGSLYLLNEKSKDNPDVLFYLVEPLGGWNHLEEHKCILTSERIILLERVTRDDDSLRDVQKGV